MGAMYIHIYIYIHLCIVTGPQMSDLLKENEWRRRGWDSTPPTQLIFL